MSKQQQRPTQPSPQVEFGDTFLSGAPHNRTNRTNAPSNRLTQEDDFEVPLPVRPRPPGHVPSVTPSASHSASTAASLGSLSYSISNVLPHKAPPPVLAQFASLQAPPHTVPSHASQNTPTFTALKAPPLLAQFSKLQANERTADANLKAPPHTLKAPPHTLKAPPPHTLQAPTPPHANSAYHTMPPSYRIPDTVETPQGLDHPNIISALDEDDSKYGPPVADELSPMFSEPSVVSLDSRKPAAQPNFVLEQTIIKPSNAMPATPDDDWHDYDNTDVDFSIAVHNNLSISQLSYPASHMAPPESSTATPPSMPLPHDSLAETGPPVSQPHDNTDEDATPKEAKRSMWYSQWKWGVVALLLLIVLISVVVFVSNKDTGSSEPAMDRTAASDNAPVSGRVNATSTAASTTSPTSAVPGTSAPTGPFPPPELPGEMVPPTPAPVTSWPTPAPSTPMPTPVPDPVEVEAQPTEPPEPTSNKEQRAADIVAYINSITTSGQSLSYPMDPNMPSTEALALQWIIDTDPLPLVPDNAANQFRLRQRYALRTLWIQQDDERRGALAWDQGDECEWSGVKCTTFDVQDIGTVSCVTTVNIVQRDLVGTISSDFGLLWTLEKVDLWNNQIGGTLPAALGGLASLWYLSVQTNFLTGTLPSEIGQWTNLEYFSVAENAMTGTIPPSISKWAVIEEARFDSNEFTGAVPDGVCTAVVDCTCDALLLSCALDVECSCCTVCNNQSDEDVGSLEWFFSFLLA